MLNALMHISTWLYTVLDMCTNGVVMSVRLDAEKLSWCWNEHVCQGMK